MMKTRFVLFLGIGVVSGLMMLSCGKSDEQKQLEAAAEAAKKAAAAAQEAAKNATGATSSGSTAAKPANAVDFHKLEDFLPNSISGYTADKKNGASMSTGEGTWSTAECKYTNGDSRITVSIFDYAANASLMEVYKMKFAFESEDGYTKTTTFASYPGWETWEKNNQSASCAAIVGDRFVVVVAGDKQTDAATVRGVLAAMNLSGIAGL